ncbi:deoxyribodipyrimidine photolyase [Maritimibacter sp. 55A14]|uniref:cryptochrome/photolyase family protein n=1 Tax=Maritimibacter sp. 55A14 TaxID=2174844 RepID=UPI000D606DC9|nr:deoxyribodipyrimidine photo-lyase [Maritimibacter sp. 55A14]PWE34229.1 deoxyribodipyrimidine photolyase [Maritimibacter sp. 55A14]
MRDASPVILWLRRDFRLADHPALHAAASSGRPVIPVFIHDELVETLGAAPKWRLGLAVEAFAARLAEIGSRLTLRRGPALEVLRELAAETGAGAVWWSRAYDPDAVARDTGVKAGLVEDGLAARSHPGHLLFEPWTVETQQGGFYKVFSPMWRAVKDRELEAPFPAVTSLAAPETWPQSARLADWAMGAAMGPGAVVLARHVCVGERAAQGRLGAFIDRRIAEYKARRDYPAEPATSRLSENLTYGEIGPRTVWLAGLAALRRGAPGAEHFLKELGWREFAYHLAWHAPRITHANWRPEWDAFPWSEDEDTAVLRWKQGRTGIAFVDAAMREMYVTGRMHNRARMIAGSYLTKHMMKHWRIGQRWFEECLIDWDPASNAMGWQWVAGSGPDAAPYFRIFNPDTQLAKFDPGREYVARYVAERAGDRPGADALAFFEAAPRSWNLSPDMAVPEPLVALDTGRRHALAAYRAREMDKTSRT